MIQARKQTAAPKRGNKWADESGERGRERKGGGISSERDVERLNAVLTGIFPVSGLTDGAATTLVVPRPQHVMVIGSSVLGDLEYRSARVERFSDVSQIQLSKVIAGAMKHQLDP